MLHLNKKEWLFTPSGNKRGYIQPEELRELWFHTGTICNLSCPFCLEGSGPGDTRLQPMTLEDVKPFIDEALTLGVEQFSFTGGEPFVVKEFVRILDYALQFRPCLVLTNATEPLMNRLAQVVKIKEHPNPLKFRVSLDYPDPEKHDAGRGKGNFRKALKTMRLLHQQGFPVSIARQEIPGENTRLVNRQFEPHLKEAGLPANINFVVFPEFHLPGSIAAVPEVTEDCMTTYKDERSRSEFMCNYSKMVVKKEGKMRVYACTLVDDDEDFDLGGSLSEAMKVRVMLKHHRCYSCFASGASCSELNMEQGEFTDIVISDSKNFKGKESAKMDNIKETVQEYYGRVLRNKNDLKTSACCPTDSIPAEHREILRLIQPEVQEKFYGCGSPLPPDLEGCTVLDLGCGTGRDVFLASKLVGPKGRVIGVDMTDEQLEVARRNLYLQMERFGYAKPNVEFHKGFIEDLKSLGIEDNSVDVVISNCVINLSPDKHRVFSEIFRVLKPGGELYFSDVFAGRRVPEHLKSDPVLLGECLAGAMYVEDFRRMLRDIGIPDYRVISKTPIEISNPEIEQKAGMIDFYSITVRVFKLDDLEDLCEDYGQVGIYRGTVPGHPHRFALDDHHLFETGRPMLICGNTASMLQNTRYSRHFQVIGDRSVHYGEFDCSKNLSFGESNGEGGACGC
ncbi:MAG: hypothetical protein Kow0037_11510 [Calditrichia bacterium]